MKSKAYLKGKPVNITDIAAMAERKELILVETRCDSTQYYAFELLSWQLRSLLRVSLFTLKKISI